MTGSPIRFPIGIYEKAFPAELSWGERLALAARCGYDFVEISIDESDARLARLDWTPAERWEVRRAIERTGAAITTMGVSAHRKFPLGSASPELRQRGLEILRQSIQLAADIGCQIVQLMGYDVYYEPHSEGTVARYIAGLRQGARWASAAGVMLGLENVDIEFVNSVDKALPIVAAVDSPWFSIFPDVGNMTAAGYDPVAQLKLAGRGMVGVHVKDVLPGEVRGVFFGTGIVPFEQVFQTLAKLDFCSPMVVELWGHLDKTGDLAGSAVKARNFVGGLIETAWANMPEVVSERIST